MPTFLLVDASVESRRRGSAAEIPTGHHVREHVVVNGFVVLVGTDDTVEVRGPIGLDPHTRRPVARGFDQETMTGSRRKGHVARPVGVAASRPGDVRDDVHLVLSSADGHQVSGLISCGSRCGIETQGGRLPRKASAAVPLRARGLERLRKPLHAVLDDRPRRRRMRRGEEWQHEDVGVPEHVASVRVAGQSARADSSFAVIGNRCHQVEQRDPGCELQVLVALDADVGFGPAFRPGPPLFAEQPLETSVTRLDEARTRGIRSLRFDVDRFIHGDAIEMTISARLLDGRDCDGTARARAQPSTQVHRPVDGSRGSAHSIRRVPGPSR